MRRRVMGRRAVALAVPLLIFVSGCLVSDNAVVVETPSLTLEQAIELGRAVAPYVVRAEGGSLGDLAVQAYVRSVGERVARSTPLRDLPYQFAVVDSDGAGALALPGGSVCVTRGLLEQLETEGELAAVLAHLLAHINARHVGWHLQDRLGSGVLVEAASAAARQRGGPAPAECPAYLGRVVEAIRQLRYRPEDEAEADHLALDYMAAAGYNPRQMERLVAMLAKPNGAKMAAWRRMHPNPDDRAGRIRDIIERKYERRGGRIADVEYKREVLDRLKPS